MQRFPLVTVCAGMACLALVLAIGCSSDDPPTEPDPCSIELVQPEGGEEIIVPPMSQDDELVTVQWNAGGGGEVDIELLKSGALRGDIVTATPNDGYYFWRIEDPEDLALLDGTGDDYAIRVTSTTDGTCTDTSPVFRIWDRDGCAVTVTVAYDGSNFDPPDDAVAGDPMTISWLPTNTTGSYDIYFYQAFGSTVTDSIAPIAIDVSGTEYANWIMHSFHTATSGRYAIQVRDHDNPDCFGNSQAFTMLDPDICVIDVLRPNGGDSPLTLGQVIDIIWNTTNTSGTLDIKLRTNTLEFVATIRDGWDAGMNFPWTVSKYGFEADDTQQYRIFVYDAADEYCVGRSGSFMIQPAP